MVPAYPGSCGMCASRPSGDSVRTCRLIILARDYSWAKTALRKAKRQVVTLRRRARAKRSAQPITTPE